MPQRVGGIAQFNVNGVRYRAKGNFTYNLGNPKRDGVLGADGIHGFMEKPQIPFIEGVITITDDLDVADLLALTEGTVILDLLTNKSVVLRQAWFAGEANASTEEGELPVRFEGLSAEEVRA